MVSYDVLNIYRGVLLKIIWDMPRTRLRVYIGLKIKATEEIMNQMNEVFNEMDVNKNRRKQICDHLFGDENASF